MSEFNEPWTLKKVKDGEVPPHSSVEYLCTDAKGNQTFLSNTDIETKYNKDWPKFNLDWRRIVACVNFLEGVDTVMLERFVAHPNESPLRDCRRHIELWVTANPHIFGDDDIWKDLWKDGTPTP